VDVGVRRTEDAGCDGCVAPFGSLGGGLTLEPFGRALMLFALAKLDVSAPLEPGFFDVLRVGVGPHAGFRVRFSDEISSLFTGQWTYLPGQEPTGIYELHGAFRAQYTRDFALGIEARKMNRAASVQGVSYIYF
jgi:hypothetical protein